MTNLQKLPPTQGLTRGDGIWRLDWLGECAYPVAIRRYSQPSVKAVLSAVLCDKDDQAALLSPEGTEHRHQIERWIAISALPILTIGSLWQKGVKVVEPNYQVEAFKNLKINSDTASFIKAGKDLDEHFLLPMGIRAVLYFTKPGDTLNFGVKSNKGIWGVFMAFAIS